MAIMAITALALARLRELFAVVMLSGIFTLTAAAVYLVMDAPDVAFTEAAVGAGIATMLMLATLVQTGHREKAHGPVLAPLAMVTVTGAALIYATLDMPAYGDPAAPAHRHVAPHYIERAVPETGVPNLVTAVLASYRGYDTLGEVVVIFTAAAGVLVLIGRGRRRRGERDEDERGARAP